MKRAAFSLFILAATALAAIAWLIFGAWAAGSESVWAAALRATPAVRWTAHLWHADKAGEMAAWSGVVAVVGTFIAVAGIGWAVLWHPAARDYALAGRVAPGAAPARGLAAVWCAVFVVMLGTALLDGGFHDYAAYLQFWDVVWAGADPWRTPTGSPNAYGPAFLLLAPAAAVSTFLPRALFLAAIMAVWLFLTRQMALDPARPVARAPWLAAAFALAPPIWLMVPVHGTFDVLPAAAALAAVHLTRMGQPAMAGIAGGLGVLLKFYPLAVVPFLAVRDRRIDARFVLGLAAALAAGFGLAYAIWGWAFLYPFTFAADRGPKNLSIFYFLAGRGGVFAGEAREAILSLSLPLMATMGGAVFAICVWRRVPAAAGALLGIVTALAFYKVGHLQFYAIVLFLAGYLWAVEREGAIADPAFRRSLVALMVLLSAYAMVFAWLDFWFALRQGIQHYIGLPMLAAQAAVVVSGLVYYWRRGTDGRGGAS